MSEPRNWIRLGPAPVVYDPDASYEIGDLILGVGFDCPCCGSPVPGLWQRQLSGWVMLGLDASSDGASATDGPGVHS